MSLNVIFANVDYQENVRTTLPVGRSVEDALRTEAFPAYPRMDFPFLSDYSGIKVFPVEDFIAISYFFNEGRKDSSGRPVLSAKVAVIPQKLFNSCGRDIEAMKIFLKNTKLEAESSQSFMNFIREESAVFNKEKFVRLINFLGEERAAKAVDCIMSHSRVNIYYKDKSLAESLVRLVYLLLPISVVASSSYSSECSYLSGLQRENYVLTEGEGSEGERKEVGFLNVDSGKASSGKYFKKLKILIKEITSGSEWYPLTWEEKYFLLLELVEAWFSGRKIIKMTEMSEKLRKVQETIDAIRQLEKV